MTNSMQISNPQDMIQQFKELGFDHSYSYSETNGDGVTLSHDEIGLIYVEQINDKYNIRYEIPMSQEQYEEISDRAFAAGKSKNYELYRSIMSEIEADILVSTPSEVFSHLKQIIK